MGAGYTLFRDITTVSILLDKLPDGMQESWYHQRTTLRPCTNPTEDGAIIEQWLHAEGDAANLVRWSRKLSRRWAGEVIISTSSFLERAIMQDRVEQN